MTGARGAERPVEIPAQPYPFACALARTALIVIDMQRDFLEPGGFGELLGNDVGQLARTIAPTRRLLQAARAAKLLVVHTREGHRPDLRDCPPTKRARGRLTTGIGDEGPNGRVLVRGERGHAIIDELAPVPDEVVVDKPGKGAFYATGLEQLLLGHGVTSLLVAGVTTEVCVHTTVREANDRAFECLVLEDCVGSYTPDLHEAGLAMICAQGGIFGWVGSSPDVLSALRDPRDSARGGRPPGQRPLGNGGPSSMAPPARARR